MMLGPPTQQTLVPLMVNMVNPRANIGATGGGRVWMKLGGTETSQGFHHKDKYHCRKRMHYIRS